jgi:hypothetical protein
MILPDKYVSIESSYVGISAFIINLIDKNEYTVDKLWNLFNKKYNARNKTILKTIPTFQKFLTVLNFMFAVGFISYKTNINGSGVVYNENFKP